MKRTERHHLKENELAHTVGAAMEFIDAHRQHVLMGLGAVVVVGLLGGGLYAFLTRTDARGEELLAEAMTTLNARVVPATPAAGAAPGELPAAASIGAIGTYATQEAKLTAALPKLKAAADAFPDSPAGITARYHYAGSLAALGRYAEAIQAFDQVSAQGANTIYGRMAALGKADAQAQSGQLDQAIETWKAEVARQGTAIPEDALLMQLAKAYQTKGSVEDARQTLSRLVEQHPASPYVAEARAELERLKS